MSETPKFEVIDRRKIKAEEEKESAHRRLRSRHNRLRRPRQSLPLARAWW